MGALLSTWDDPPVWTISLLVRPLLLSLANTPPSLAEADAGLDVLIQATVASLAPFATWHFQNARLSRIAV